MSEENNHTKPATKVGDVYFFPDEKGGGACGPCNHRSSLERLLILLLLLLTAVAVAVIVVLATKPHATTSSSANGVGHTQEKQDLCLTPDCIKAASRIMEAMDPKVEPCEDFFEYACGAWNRDHVIPDDRSNYDTFSKLRDDLQVTLKGLLEAESQPQEPYAITQAKYIYQSCINMDTIESRGDRPLRVLLNHLGGWPVLDQRWDENSYDLEALLSKLRLFNNRIFINQWVSSDDKNSTQNILQIDQATVGLVSRDYFLRGRNDTQLMAYQVFAIDVATAMGADYDIASREMTEMVDFEIQIANLTTPDADRRDSEALYNKMTVADLYTNVTNKFDWVRYLNLIFANVSMNITRQEPVVVYAPEYLRNVVELIENTPPRTVVNYMIWRIVMNRVGNLHQKFLDLRVKFAKALYGVATHRPRWRTCVSTANDNFGMAVGRLFVKTKFDENSKSVALDMIQNIRNAFNNLLTEVEWMDDATREVARQKADAISEKIGYPEYILNDTALNEDYQEIEMDPEKYFENILSNLNFVAASNLQKLGKPVDRDKWFTSPAIVNAFYSGTKNQIMFPAAIFQPPFYHSSYPKYLCYGGIGMAIGHEISHGFDDEGRQFDLNGNLRQWWSENVIDAFKARAQCIIDQYGNYTVPEIDMQLNGRNTQGENIADNGGLKQAYRAYRDWVKSNGKEEPKLPGLQMSNNQVFFMNFAQIWCGSARKESYIQAISSGRHSPGRFRVIGTLSNSHDFAQAFSCPEGSKMNPVKKCKVW